MRRTDCPAELKILVADMLSAHENYVQAHDLLFTATTHEDLHAASVQAVENYLENRRIWKELNHYKRTGELLGEHPIFSWIHRQKEIRSMRVSELVKLKARLENNLVRNRAALRRQPGHPQTRARQNRIKKMEMELSEVNRLINL
ncbi:MAG TPA: hypothetical protein PKN44_13090 [Bacteroidales bacterium]|nr:hypothetical protein [Bacteroidales bacterium]HPS51719.1 hypothetical protein [Bacteroidales bacterium]